MTVEVVGQIIWDIKRSESNIEFDNTSSAGVSKTTDNLNPNHVTDFELSMPHLGCCKSVFLGPELMSKL